MIKVGELFRKEMVKRITDGVSSKSSTFVVSYSDLNSKKTNKLRKDLNKKESEMYVSRNTLARIALKESGYEELAGDLDGQTAFVWTDCDAAEIAKQLVDFSKDCETFSVKGGILDNSLLRKEDVKRLSDLPSREVLIAQLLAAIQSPLTGLASVLNGKTRELLNVLKQISEQKGGNQDV